MKEGRKGGRKERVEGRTDGRKKDIPCRPAVGDLPEWVNEGRKDGKKEGRKE